MDPPLPPPPLFVQPPPPPPPVVPPSTTTQPPPPPPSSIPPPHNHTAHAANATPTVPASFNHPPYAEMIYAAITALKERDGSSKRAIAKYIETAYTGLPPAHAALLTHHLKRLRNSGLLVMVKKSYKLPRSDSAINNNTTLPTTSTGTTTTTNICTQPQLQQPPPQPLPQPLPHVGVAVNSASPGLKRGRGRPPKPKANASVVSPPNPVSQANGQPIAGAAQPFLVSLGLADDPDNAVVKRGPGSPKTGVAGEGGPVPVSVSVPVVGKRRRGRPPKGGLGMGPKKSAGRPRKPKSIGNKRGPGRPRKTQLIQQQQQQQPNLLSASLTAAAAEVFNAPKPRGRPRKAAAAQVPVAVPGVDGGGVGVSVVVPAKPLGRPPKASGATLPKKSSGRPVGRPKKNASAAWANIEASQSQLQADVYGDLKRKFEFVQSRVKQAVGLLRPHLAGAPISALVAIQDLEGIASMDINAPLQQEPQPQPQPQNQPLPQPQPLSQLQPYVLQN